MRVFVAGASGVIGGLPVPRLGAAGHGGHGRTGSEPRRAMVRGLGAVPVVADALGAKQPLPVPRLAAGEAGAVLMTGLRGAANASGGREPGWRPGRPGWRRGFAA